VVKKKIGMLGSFGVGKTSLVARFVHSMFSDKYHTTVGVKIDKKIVRVDGSEVTLMLWDMAGEEANAPVKIHQIRDAAGYLLVVDGCRSQTLETALSIQQRVENEIGPVFANNSLTGGLRLLHQYFKGTLDGGRHCASKSSAWAGSTVHLIDGING